MKIIFFGTPGFAATTLKFLIDNGHEILAVVSAPDSRKGRGKQLEDTQVKTLAIDKKIAVLQPLNLKDPDFVNKLKSFNADLFVVVAFRMLPEVVWKIPGKGTINLHTSFLPDYRGSAPINWVLINGENYTGITTFFIDHQIDTGPIIMQEKIKLLNSTTAGDLHNILMLKGYDLLDKTLVAIKNKLVNQTIQTNEITIKKAPKITKELLKIDWNKSAIEIHNLVRGLSPYLSTNSYLKDIAICPSAWFILENDLGKQKRIKLLLTKVEETKHSSHLSIHTDNKSYLKIIILGKALSFLNLQVEGKKPINIQQFLIGNKLNKKFKIL